MPVFRYFDLQGGSLLVELLHPKSVLGFGQFLFLQICGYYCVVVLEDGIWLSVVNVLHGVSTCGWQLVTFLDAVVEVLGVAHWCD